MQQWRKLHNKAELNLEQFDKSWFEKKLQEQSALKQRIRKTCRKFEPLEPERPAAHRKFLTLPEKNLSLCLQPKVRKTNLFSNSWNKRGCLQPYLVPPRSFRNCNFLLLKVASSTLKHYVIQLSDLPERNKSWLVNSWREGKFHARTNKQFGRKPGNGKDMFKVTFVRNPMER